MIIGHLPAGYVVAILLHPRFAATGVALRPFLWAGMIGAIAPDFDILYFLLLDHRQHHHHSYFTHFPIFWISLQAISGLWFYAARIKHAASLATLFSLNG